VLSITVEIAGDDTCSRSPDIARCSKNVNKANVNIVETRIRLVYSKELAEIGFVVKGWLQDSIKRDIPLWQNCNARGIEQLLCSGTWILEV
jgi:hypothetical protein